MIAPSSGELRLPILLVAPQPFYSDRGTPIAVRQVLEALSGLGLEVDVVTFPVGRDVNLPGVRVFRCANPFGIRHVPVGFSVRKVLLDLSLSVLIRQRLRSRRYAYIHAVEEAAIITMILGLNGGAPVLYDMQSSLPEQLSKHWLFGLAPFQRLLEAVERRLLRKARLTVASWGLRERVERVQPGARVEEWKFPQAFSPAPDFDVAQVRWELELQPRDQLVLYCGTFEPYQGLPILVDALPSVLKAAPDTVLALVGGDELQSQELRRQADLLGVSSRVRILLRQPRSRIAAFLSAADVLVSTRAYGGNLPLKVFDYVAAGKPMVVTDIAGAGRLLGSNVAELVDASAESMANGLIRVLRNPDRAAGLGRNAKAFADKHLVWERFTASIKGLVAAMSGSEAPLEVARDTSP